MAVAALDDVVPLGLPFLLGGAASASADGSATGACASSTVGNAADVLRGLPLRLLASAEACCGVASAAGAGDSAIAADVLLGLPRGLGRSVPWLPAAAAVTVCACRGALTEVTGAHDMEKWPATDR